MSKYFSSKTLAAFAALGAISVAPLSQAAPDEWSFGIGTGLRSLALDGDVGFATGAGGVVEEMDLDNGDTADMFESAFGFASFANKGPWTIRLAYATLTLEDDNSNFDAEWDKAQGELSVEYTFATTGKHRWGVIGGVSIIDHEWEFQDKVTREKLEPEEDWTDGLVGLTHNMPFNQHWSWSSRVDYNFGDSEGGYMVSTGVNWKPGDNWVFNASLAYEDVEYGDEGDINDNDFYYYDVEETTIGVGFMYTW